MTRDKFRNLVLKVISELPDEFKGLLENVDIVIEDWPTRRQLKNAGVIRRSDLLGLYEGVPRTVRDQSYNMVLPDKISIFQKPIELQCRSLKQLKIEIARTVKHEIAHHFGLSDAQLDKIEKQYYR
jgi:predicted Zn-dependent protease with MMP-like domain